jgi:ABC-type lipoprotein release transport system permease subunit
LRAGRGVCLKMSVVIELALLLSRSTGSPQLPRKLLGLRVSELLNKLLLGTSRWLPNKSIGLNIVAITSGVAFLAFALAIYDGYRDKVERIIFSLTPHVMVRPGLHLARDDGDSRDEMAICLKVCREPFSVHTPDNAKQTTATRFDDGSVRAITQWAAASAPSGTSVSRVLFEEAKLEVRSKSFSTGGLRPMHLLGLEILYGDSPAPRIDLTFSDPAVGGRFRAGSGILISDALADEIAEANGAAVVPGLSMIRIGPAGDMREVQIAGIHRLGIHAISRNLVIAPYRLAAQLIGSSTAEGPTYVGLNLADPGKARDVGDRLRRALASEELAAVAWQSVTDLFDQLELYRWIISVTLSLSILVTAINTFVNISILIRERAEQIGILRAIGLPPARLLSVFMTMGLFQSIVGTTLGYGLGILIGYLLDDYINSLVRDFIPITDARILPNPLAYASLLAFVSLVSVSTCALAGHRALKSAISQNLRGA